MSDALYMDQHVPAAATAGLRRRGVDVVTPQDDGTSDWSDDRLLDRATALGRAIVTFDRDLHAIAATWVEAGRSFAGVIYAHPQRISIGELIDELTLIAQAADTGDVCDRVVFLPL